MNFFIARCAHRDNVLALRQTAVNRFNMHLLRQLVSYRCSGGRAFSHLAAFIGGIFVYLVAVAPRLLRVVWDESMAARALRRPAGR